MPRLYLPTPIFNAGTGGAGVAQFPRPPAQPLDDNFTELAKLLNGRLDVKNLAKNASLGTNQFAQSNSIYALTVDASLAYPTVAGVAKLYAGSTALSCTVVGMSAALVTNGTNVATTVTLYISGGADIGSATYANDPQFVSTSGAYLYTASTTFSSAAGTALTGTQHLGVRIAGPAATVIGGLITIFIKQNS